MDVKGVAKPLILLRKIVDQSGQLYAWQTLPIVLGWLDIN